MEKCEMLAYSEQQGVCLFYHHHWKSDLCDVKGDWMMMTKGEANLTMTVTVCLNGGDVKEDGVSCQCYHGYVGDRCQRVMEDCYEGKMSRHYPSLGSGDQAVLWAQPRSMEQPVQVRCQENANTIIQRRVSPSIDFNRTWQEYVDGFGDVGQDFWMGLRNLYLFTNARQYDLVFYFTLNNGTYFFSIYKDFRITENITYTASLGAYVENPSLNGRPLQNMSGKPFSTYDNDNDNAVGSNCGERFGGGWWFDACSELNANGRPMTTGVWSGKEEEVHYTELGNNAPISMSLRLKIPLP
ncbi:angiopoietin-related protein 1-like [Littorina saxatilis]|uniref:angiopoietin-related protein 1-like n=1 Tax=Littorina saxatilis TaxID=31220 RepID=UPI0038B6996C